MVGLVQVSSWGLAFVAGAAAPQVEVGTVPVGEADGVESSIDRGSGCCEPGSQSFVAALLWHRLPEIPEWLGQSWVVSGLIS